MALASYRRLLLRFRGCCPAQASPCRPTERALRVVGSEHLLAVGYYPARGAHQSFAKLIHWPYAPGVALAVEQNPLFCDPVFLNIEHVVHGIFHIGQIATVRFVVDEPTAPDGLRHVKKFYRTAVGCAVQIVTEHLEFDI